MKHFFYFDQKTTLDGSVQTDGAPVFAVVAFERGFHPVFTHASAAQLNRGTPPDAVESALAASMFGWNVPAALPARRYVEAAERAEPVRNHQAPGGCAASAEYAELLEQAETMRAALQRIANSEPRPAGADTYEAHDVENLQRIARVALRKVGAP